MRWLLSDFHVHTSMSDGSVLLFKVIDLFGRGGVKVLNISDHLNDTISDYGKRVHAMGRVIKDWREYSRELGNARRYAQKKYGMLVIRRAEITNYIDGFHIMAVDLKKNR